MTEIAYPGPIIPTFGVSISSQPFVFYAVFLSWYSDLVACEFSLSFRSKVTLSANTYTLLAWISTP